MLLLSVNTNWLDNDYARAGITIRDNPLYDCAMCGKGKKCKCTQTYEQRNCHSARDPK